MNTEPTDLDLCTNAQAELAAILDEQEPVSQLPAGWQRFRTVQLEELLSEFAEPFLTDDDYDAVMEELGARDREAEQLAGHHHDQLDDPHNERPFP